MVWMAKWSFSNVSDDSAILLRADDYSIKPFDSNELLARLQALRRRVCKREMRGRGVAASEDRVTLVAEIQCDGARTEILIRKVTRRRRVSGAGDRGARVRALSRPSAEVAARAAFTA